VQLVDELNVIIIDGVISKPDNFYYIFLKLLIQASAFQCKKRGLPLWDSL